MARIETLKGDGHRPGIVVATSYGTEVKQISEKEFYHKLVRSNLIFKKNIRG